MKYAFAIIIIFCLVPIQAPREIRKRRQIHFPEEEEEEGCSTPDRRRGICVPLNNCRELRRASIPYLTQSICGYNRNTPIVCCPETEPSVVNARPTRPVRRTRPTRPTRRTIPTVPPTTPSRRDPVGPNRRKPSILPTECGKSKIPASRIIGGKKSELGAWPWMAAVYLTRSGLSRGTDCGGALVSSKHVITAAHCVFDTRRGTVMSASSFTVRLGEHTLNDDNDGASPIDVPVRTILAHENFERRTFKNDIAILTLQNTVQFNDLIRPICLPYNELNQDNLARRSGFVVGWGTTAFNGQFNPIMSEIQIPIVENDECRRIYQREVPITKEYLCAGVSDGTKDSCQGDSGGPFMLPTSDTRFYLVGVVSFGKRCATPGYPGVYTRVTMYLDWLAENLK